MRKIFSYTKLVALIGLTVGVLLSASAPVSAATAIHYVSCTAAAPQPIQYGDRGTCVTAAQKLLVSKGVLHATPNGVFGPATKTAVLQFQANSGISQLGLIGPQTWAALNGGSKATTATTTPRASSGLPASCITTAKSICIVKGAGSHATLYAVQNGKSVRQFLARTGDARGDGYITDQGVFDVYFKDATHKSHEYNNASMPYSLFFNGGEAIHYSNDFAAYGYSAKGAGGASHGCVNLNTLSGAQWLFNWAPYHTRVVVTR